MRKPYNERPTCNNEGCGKPVAMIQDYYDGTASWRKVCSHCHKKHLAKKNGFDSVTDLVNLWHPYRKFRKDYCENIDGRLGFVCTSNIVWNGMLDVDHIDGNPSNNTKENMQTLCKCCHAYKTVVNKDYATPGRKMLGLAAP